MEVREVGHRGDRALRGALLECLPLIGTSALEGHLFSTLRRFSDTRLMTVIAFNDAGPSDIWTLDGDAHLPVASMTTQYRSTYWSLDPVNRLVNDSANGREGPFLVSVDPHDVPDPTYRRSFYDEPGLTRRLSLVYPSGSTNTRFNLYLGEGGADARYVDGLAECSDLFLAIASAQMAAYARRRDGWQPERMTARIREIAPQLSAREAEICAGIVLGQSSEAIALDLGVSIGTVQEFRKRAYRKLDISSQNELMRMVLTLA